MWLFLLWSCSARISEDTPNTPPPDTHITADDTSTGDRDSGDTSAEDTAGGTDTTDTGEDTPEPQPRAIYLLGGQSNMDGAGLVSGLSPSLQLAQDDVDMFWSGGWTWQGLAPASYWGTSYFGPEIVFGRTMKNANPKQDISLIKHAESGTNLASCWYPGESRDDPTQGSCYVNFLATFDAAMAGINDDHTIAGMIWMQGESDACDAAMASNYADNLRHFITRVREDVNAPDMPFAMGKIDCTWHCAYRDIVRQAQQTVADESDIVHIVETVDLPQNLDLLHFDASGMRTLGQRLAERLLGEPPSDTPQPAFELNASTPATSGYSHYTGNYLVGYSFTIDRWITVTDLGTLDYGLDGLSDGSTVAIWDAETQDMVARTILPSNASAATSIWGGWRFAAIEPTVLEPGEYIIGSQVYSGSLDRYMHNVSATPAEGVAWVNGRHSHGTSVTLPTVISNGAISWFGPNFLFTEL